jgi:hypothetical protein
MFLIILSLQANSAVVPWRRPPSPPCVIRPPSPPCVLTSHGCFPTSTLSLAVTLLVYVQEVPVSNLGRNTGYPDWVGFKVLTPVVMKSCTFRDITRYNPVKARRYLGGTYRLHLQGRRKKPEWSRLTFRGLHGIISQTLFLSCLRLIVAFLSLSMEIPG